MRGQMLRDRHLVLREPCLFDRGMVSTDAPLRHWCGTVPWHCPCPLGACRFYLFHGAAAHAMPYYGGHTSCQHLTSHLEHRGFAGFRLWHQCSHHAHMHTYRAHTHTHTHTHTSTHAHTHTHPHSRAHIPHIQTVNRCSRAHRKRCGAIPRNDTFPKPHLPKQWENKCL